jgi:hypothetical protein
MSGYQQIQTLEKNPAIAERQQKINWFIIQGVAYGLMLGIMVRAAWDQGIISAFAMVFRDLGAALGVMLQDSASACWDFVRFVFR